MTIQISGFHDPADVADYIIDFEADLESVEGISLQSITIDATSAAAGMVLGSGSYSASAAGKRIRFWLTCANPNNPVFDAGLRCIVTATVQTSATPPRTMQRSVGVLVRQSAPAAPAAPSAVDVLRQRLFEATNAKHRALTTGQITDVWRDGRRIKYSTADLTAIDAYIQTLTAEIRAMDPTGPEATSQPRRRAIGVRY